MKNKNTSQWIFVLIATALFLAGCGKAASAGTGQIKGVIVQKTSGISTSGTVKLMAGKYLAATPNSKATLEPSEYIEASIGKDNTFKIDKIHPGKYFLDVAVTLKPCFLGAPGQVFNGMQISFMENWNPVGLSFQNGSSLITGHTKIYEISAGKALDVVLELPKCY